LIDEKIGKVKFQIMNGLIWLQRSDAIVCPCENTTLRHEKGVARELANYAGPSIYDISNNFIAK